MAAAIELGLEAFSMQGIADHLGVTAPALYTHVRGRDEVLDLVAANLLGRLEVPASEGGDWQSWLLEFARQVRQHLAGAGPSLRVDLNEPLATRWLHVSERGLQLMIDAGFGPADAGRALWLVFRVARTAGPPDDVGINAPMAETRRVFDPAELPATHRALDALADPSRLDTFEFDLRAVLAGLEQHLRDPTPRDGPR